MPAQRDIKRSNDNRIYTRIDGLKLYKPINERDNKFLSFSMKKRKEEVHSRRRFKAKQTDIVGLSSLSLFLGLWKQRSLIWDYDYVINVSLLEYNDLIAVIYKYYH